MFEWIPEIVGESAKTAAKAMGEILVLPVKCVDAAASAVVDVMEGDGDE